jgi:hypothetical protein
MLSHDHVRRIGATMAAPSGTKGDRPPRGQSPDGRLLFAQKNASIRGMMVKMVQSIPCVAAQFGRAHVSTKLPGLAHAGRQFR